MKYIETYKSTARKKAGRALKSGVIVKKPCNACGSNNSLMHHPDYAKPLEIVWLCRKCHGKLHVNNPGSYPLELSIRKKYDNHMVDIENAIKRVDPSRIYSISEMRADNIFPWISGKNQTSYISAVLEDSMGGNLLKTRASGSGRGRRYIIKGANIVKYLKNKTHDNNTT